MRGIPPIPEAQVRRFLLLALLTFAIALVPVAARTSPSVRAVTPDETFSTVAGATAHVWTGTPATLGTAGGTLPVQVSAVFEWSNSGQAFKFWFRGFPLNFNTLATLNTDGYYFFQATGGVLVTIPGSAGHTFAAAPASFNTVVGASGVLWLGGDLPIAQLPPGISAVFRWENTTQSFQFSFAGFPSSFNTLPGPLTVGQFYFLQSSTATTITVPPLPASPTSAELIDAALAANTLAPLLAGTTAPETARLYKIFADFGDPRLPAQYKGAKAEGNEPESFEGIKGAYPGFSSAAKALVDPFLLPPAAQGSWFEVKTAARGAGLGAGSRAAPSWENVSNTRLKVWWLTSRPTDRPIAAQLLTELETKIWPKLVNLMGAGFAPPSDLGFNGGNVNGDGGDDKFDVYMVGDTADYGVANALAFNRAYSQPPCPQPGPSFMVVGAAPSFSELKSTVAHEFMHAIQKAYFQCSEPYKWVREATATWAESFVYPDVDEEQKFLPSFFTRMDAGHSIDSLEGTHAYGAYLWFYFLTQRDNDNDIIRAIFAAAPNNPSPHVVIDTAVGSMQRRWHEFALATLNVGPIVHQFATWDGIVDSSLRAPVVLGANGFFIAPVSVPYMGVATKLVTISAVHPAGADIKITHPVSAPPSTVRFQVMLKRNGVWQPPVTIAGQEMTFCADSSANRIQQVAMVLSNAEYTDFTTVQTGNWDVEVTSGPCVPTQFTGTLTLQAFKDYGTGTETTLTTAHVTANIVETFPGNWVLKIVSISGDGSFVSAFPSGCDRPPETDIGTITSGTIGRNFDFTEVRITPRLTGTHTSTTCTQTFPSAWSGSLREGTFVGTPVFSGGNLTSIDFNRSTTTSNDGSKVTTGRLQ